MRALCLYNHYGYYYEAGSFVDEVLPYLNELVGDDELARWNYIGNMFQGLVTTGKEEPALKLIQQFATPYLTQPALLAKMHYLLAMVYLRYLKVSDVSLAEKHIMLSVNNILAAKGKIPDAEFAFLTVFINNGLAFVRVRQDRKGEALDLCRSGFAFLTDTLGGDKHQLHRSVLLYNSAQVFMSLGQPDEALHYYNESILMDPYYSEYYNESGNILQRQEHYAEALARYDMAIKYSAPYPEVYFNKGICYSQLGEWEQAIACFSYSLEMNPDQEEVYVIRAEILEGMGRDKEALDDYCSAIKLGKVSATARVNRAVMYYAAGQLEQALADMNYVLACEPTVASHYENRSEIYKAMNMREQSAQDLSMAQRYAEAA